MGIAIGLTGTMMPVILAKRSQFFQPLVDILDQSVFSIIDIDARGDMHGGNENHPLADPALRSAASICGVILMYSRCFLVESKVFCVEVHNGDNSGTGYCLTRILTRSETFIMLIRPGAICVALLIFACGSTLLAQQPAASAPPPAGAATAAPAQDAQQPALTPEQQRAPADPPIRSAGPQQRQGYQSAGKSSPRGRETEERRISLRRRVRSPRRNGMPRVRQDPGSPKTMTMGDEPVQEYTGPAVLSRSYSVTRPLIPQQLKWTETLGISTVMTQVSPRSSTRTERSATPVWWGRR